MWHYLEEDRSWHFFIGLTSACGFFKIQKRPKAGRKPSRENACGKCWSEWKRASANAAAPQSNAAEPGGDKPAAQDQ